MTSGEHPDSLCSMNTTTDWDDNSQNRIEGAKDEFYKARKDGCSCEEAFEIARDAYNLSVREYDAMLHQLH